MNELSIEEQNAVTERVAEFATVLYEAQSTEELTEALDNFRSFFIKALVLARRDGRMRANRSLVRAVASNN